MTNCDVVRNTMIICAAFWRKVIESHSGMRASGRLYGFGLLFAWAAELFARVVEDELAAERAVAVSLKELIWGLDFSSKDSVNEFIGVNCLSSKSSAKAAENAPKIAMINRIFMRMYCAPSRMTRSFLPPTVYFLLLRKSSWLELAWRELELEFSLDESQVRIEQTVRLVAAETLTQRSLLPF